MAANCSQRIWVNPTYLGGRGSHGYEIFFIMSLVISNAHIVLKQSLAFDQIKLSDQLDKVIATKSLSIFLVAFVFVYFVNQDFVFVVLRASILAKNVKLDKLEAIVSQFSCENQSVVRIHTR